MRPGYYVYACVFVFLLYKPPRDLNIEYVSNTRNALHDIASMDDTYYIGTHARTIRPFDAYICMYVGSGRCTYTQNVQLNRFNVRRISSRLSLPSSRTERMDEFIFYDVLCSALSFFLFLSIFARRSGGQAENLKMSVHMQINALARYAVISVCVLCERSV